MKRVPNEFATENRGAVHKMLDTLLDAGYDQILIRDEWPIIAVEWINTELGYQFACLNRNDEFIGNFNSCE